MYLRYYSFIALKRESALSPLALRKVSSVAFFRLVLLACSDRNILSLGRETSFWLGVALMVRSIMPTASEGLAPSSSRSS